MNMNPVLSELQQAIMQHWKKSIYPPKYAYIPSDKFEEFFNAVKKDLGSEAYTSKIYMGVEWKVFHGNRIVVTPGVIRL